MDGWMDRGENVESQAVNFFGGFAGRLMDC